MRGSGKDRPGIDTTFGTYVVFAIPADKNSAGICGSTEEEDGLPDISGDGGSAISSGDGDGGAWEVGRGRR